MEPTADSGYIMAGYGFFTSPWDGDFYLIKTDRFGNISWTRRYHASDYDFGRYVIQTNDKGFAGVGYTGIAGYSIYLFRSDSLGNLLWKKRFGGSTVFGYSIKQLKDTNYVVAGRVTSNYSDVFLCKIDTNGNVLWKKTYGSPGSEYCYSVCQSPDTGLVLAGSTNNFGGGDADILLIKTDSVGKLKWTKVIGDTLSEEAFSILSTPDYGFVIAGNTGSFGAGKNDVFLLKTDFFGNPIWFKTYGGADNDYGKSVSRTADGGFIISGITVSFGAGNKDFYLIRTDSDGNLLWSRTYGGPWNDDAYSAYSTPDGGYSIAGSTEGFDTVARAYNYYLVKTDAYGNSG
jgi:hypothetical protein